MIGDKDDLECPVLQGLPSSSGQDLFLLQFLPDEVALTQFPQPVLGNVLLDAVVLLPSVRTSGI